MDRETRAALGLTKDELRAMRDAAEPGVVAKRPKRPRDLNRLAASIVQDATDDESAMPAGGSIPVPVDLSSLTIDDLRVEPEAQRFKVAVATPED